MDHDAKSLATRCLGLRRRLPGAGVLTTVTSPAAEPARPGAAGPFRYCLNTATLIGFKLPVAQEVEIAGQAGYSGVEPWLRAVQQHVDEGKSLSDLKKRIADLGLAVEGGIDFDAWIVDDDAKRAKGIEQMKRDMDLVAQLGGRRIAARPPREQRRGHRRAEDGGAVPGRVRNCGRRMGVVPQLEIWGGSKTLGRVGEAAAVAIEAGDPDACLLLDVFHIYRSGAGFAGLRVLSGRPCTCCTSTTTRPIRPARRPPTPIAFSGRRRGPAGLDPARSSRHRLHRRVSLELFNRRYWKQDPLTVAKTGLEKTQAVVRKALGA